MNKVAVIVAGGSGTRMGGNTPKQFLLLHDKPVLYYTVKAFLDAFDDLRVVLVVPESGTDMAREIIDAYFDHSRIQIMAGGETRFHSVKAGLSAITEDAIVFVHDGVRCMVSTALIHRCYEKALEWGSAIPVIPVKDSIRSVNGPENEPMDRNSIVLVQTPQTFHSRILLPAFEIDYKERFTDEATVVETFGLKIQLVEGDEDNIKITRPVDLLIAERMLERQAAVV